MENDVEFIVLSENPTIFVDADACPVKSEVLDLAKEYGVRAVFVASIKNMMNNPEGEWVYVDADKEAADLYIINAVNKGDIVITNDIGLAATLLSKKVVVLSAKGIQYTDYTITMLLDMRYYSAKLRRSGKHAKGPKAYTKQDRMNFLEKLDGILSRITGK